MYAVIKIGSSQFKVSEGDTIEAPSLKQEEGKAFDVEKILLFAKGTDIRIGQPYLKDVQVKAKVVKHLKGPKVTAFKRRRRKDSASKKGHRQKLTALNISKITA